MSSSHCPRFGPAITVLALSLFVGCDQTAVSPTTVESVRLVPETATMEIGETLAFTGEPLDRDGAPIGGHTLTWSSSNPAVVEVDEFGVATARAGGQAVIRASVDGVSATATVEVLDEAADRPAPPSGVEVTASDEGITLSWSASGETEDEFRIERQGPEDDGFREIATVGANEASYTDTDVSLDRTYSYRVRACVSGGCSAPSNEADVTTRPLAPSSVSAAAISASQVQISWSDESVTETRFEIERRTGDGSYAELAEVGDNTTRYTDSAVAANTSYGYRLRACNADGCSDHSPEATATTSDSPAPTAPSNLVTSLDAANRQVDVQWTDESTNETGFLVQRKIAGGEYDDIATPGAGVTTLTDSALAADSVYTYRVQACGDGGCSVYSNESSVTTWPAAPSGLSAVAEGPDRIDLSWSDNSAVETEVGIERSEDGGDFSILHTSDTPGVTSFSDLGVDEATAYTYRVRACNTSGCSDPSGTAAETTPPFAPAGLDATAVSSSEITVSWTDESSSEHGYELDWREVDAGGEWTTSLLGSNEVSYSHTGLSPNTAYEYRVRACSDNVCSTYAGPVSGTTEEVPAPPSPSDLTATATAPTTVNLSWSDVSGETGYIVDRSPEGSSSYTEIGTTEADVTSFSDTNATEGISYTYRISACSAGGCSDPSGSAAVTTPPSPPTGLGATAVSSSETTVSWTDESSNEDGYELDWREADVGDDWSTIPLHSNEVSYSHTGLSPNTVYEYRVRACSGGVCSSDAGPVTATTAPAPMDTVRIVTFGDSNTDYGYAGTNETELAHAYVSYAPEALGPDDDHHLTQLAAKIEAAWEAVSSRPIVAVNHAIGGTTSGGGGWGGPDRREDRSSPHARTQVDGITRYEAEVLGMGYPWNGGESFNDSYPDGPVDRVQAFQPGPDDFAYVSMGTNDPRNGMSVSQTLTNLEWMIDTWTGAGLHPQQFILTTLAPYDRSGGELIPEINAGIRELASRRGVHLIDLANHTSDDDGLTWSDPALHVDEAHYSEQVRDWIAGQVVDRMRSWIPETGIMLVQ